MKLPFLGLAGLLGFNSSRRRSHAAAISELESVGMSSSIDTRNASPEQLMDCPLGFLFPSLKGNPSIAIPAPSLFACNHYTLQCSTRYRADCVAGVMGT